MTIKFPTESEGLGPMIGKGLAVGVVRGVNDATAELVEGFVPTRYELEVLARHYLECIGDIQFMWEAFGQSSSYGIRFWPFANRRLSKIQSILGEEDYREAITSAEEKIDKVLAEIREDVNNPRPCSECGTHRSGPVYLDDYEGICDKCRADKGEGPSGGCEL